MHVYNADHLRPFKSHVLAKTWVFYFYFYFFNPQLLLSLDSRDPDDMHFISGSRIICEV